jgi:UDP-3-O-[3-hydroxymyristoyl] glucosamine N-acyltransferase
MSVPFASRTLRELAARHGGVIRGDDSAVVRRLAPVEVASAGELAPVLSPRYAAHGLEALARGARLLVDAKLDTGRFRDAPAGTSIWAHPFASWIVHELLRFADISNTPPQIGPGSSIDPTAILLPRVIIGKNVRIGPFAVIGRDGFGFAQAPDGTMSPLLHGGGVLIGDDVHIASHVTIDAGTLAPTVLHHGAKLDSHVHIGHNCIIGAGSMIAAQAGLAGSVTLGRNVLVGGQAGIADHVRVGDGARIAAKSGVIGDVAPGAVVAGYPAVARARWLRGVAMVYRETAERNFGESETEGRNRDPDALPESER